MRTLIDKKHFTKPERVFSEILKRNHIPFKAKVKVDGKEIDFMIGKYAIEIDGHEQSVTKNNNFALLGLSPLHFSNHEVLNETKKVEQIIIKLCLQD